MFRHHRKQLEELTASSDGAWRTKTGRMVTAMPIDRPKSLVLLRYDYEGGAMTGEGHVKLQELCPKAANAYVLSEDNWVQDQEYNLLAVQFYKLNMPPKRTAASKAGMAHR